MSRALARAGRGKPAWPRCRGDGPSSFRRIASWIGLVATLSLAAEGVEFLKNVIPRDQTPLARVFPPTAAEQSPPGTGKFVIFTREEIGKPGEWDFIAGAWECIPSQPARPITKRVEFAHSSWNATPLLGGLTRDRSEGRFPRFVTLQVDAGDRSYRENLYDIDYCGWGVRCLWQGPRLDAFGVLDDVIFCDNHPGWMGIGTATGAIRKEVPFTPLEVADGYWLVRKPGETAGAWSYDSARRQFVGHFGDVAAPEMGYAWSVLGPDGRSRAWVVIAMPETWRGGAIEGMLRLQRDGRSEDLRVPVTLQARMGSGVPVIPIGAELKYLDAGRVEFAAVTKPSPREERVWTIEVATGRVVESARKHRAAPPDFAMFDGVPAPEHLRPYLKDLGHFGRGGLAVAFFRHQGILKRLPEFPACTAGISSDGRHALYNARGGKLADEFLYGDLLTKRVVRWKRPAGIDRADAMEFVWIETP